MATDHILGNAAVFGMGVLPKPSAAGMPKSTSTLADVGNEFLTFEDALSQDRQGFKHVFANTQKSEAHRNLFTRAQNALEASKDSNEEPPEAVKVHGANEVVEVNDNVEDLKLKREELVAVAKFHLSGLQSGTSALDDDLITFAADYALADQLCENPADHQKKYPVAAHADDGAQDKHLMPTLRKGVESHNLALRESEKIQASLSDDLPSSSRYEPVRLSAQIQQVAGGTLGSEPSGHMVHNLADFALGKAGQKMMVNSDLSPSHSKSAVELDGSLSARSTVETVDQKVGFNLRDAAQDSATAHQVGAITQLVSTTSSGAATGSIQAVLTQASAVVSKNALASRHDVEPPALGASVLAYRSSVQAGQVLPIARVGEALANDAEQPVFTTATESGLLDADWRAAPVFDSARPIAESVIAPKVAAAADGRSAEAARQVALQISQNASQTDSIIELQLKPEELGSVKFRMSLSETGLNIVIQADRPETQDLLRRHMDQLQSQFAALGFGEASVSLADGGGANRGSDEDSDAPGARPSTHNEQTASLDEALPMAQLGVDIRV